MLLKIKFSFSQSIINVVRQVKQNAKCKFDETIDLQIKLNVDPKHGDQQVRGNCLMPGGLGRKITLAVLTSPNAEEAAKNAGADIVGQQLLMDSIKENTFKFDKLIATPESLALLKPYAKILGPQGLMPNAKAGTLVTPDQLIDAIKGSKAGSIEFRVDIGKAVMVPVGKVSFDEKLIFLNLDAFYKALYSKKPAKLKGQLINSGILKSTMGKPIEFDVKSFQQLAQYI